MSVIIRLYREERQVWPLLFRSAELAVCAAFGSALPDILHAAAQVLL